MKARNFLWLSVVNIFLVLLVSVVMEYSDLNSRFKQLQSIVSTATDMAIRTSTASEELFSEEYKRETTSSQGAGTSNATASTLKVLSSDGKSWVEGKTYVMAKFYQENGRFPKTTLEYSTYERSNGSDESIYEWLFGEVGSVYNKMGWANSNTKLWNSTLWNGVSSSRKPTSNFKNFYENIGMNLITSTYVKMKSGDSYTIETIDIPVLTQMGLELNSAFNANSSGEGTLIANDYLNSVVHFGKSSSGIADTSYYLTPYSLGVTYVPTEVLKPAFLSYTEQLVRFNKVKHTVSSKGDLEDFASANGCITTDVYDNGVQASHTGSKSENIINDGEIEYDLSSAKVKVDYFIVDFYDVKNWKIVNRIEGATSQYIGGNRSITSSNTLISLPSRLKDKDTSDDKSGERIVAKVSVKLKVHIPYKSSVLQWFRHINGGSGNNHYDIRLWDESSNSVDVNSDGVWFYYTTYTAISR